jgi:alanyl-tRNA synthetase
MTSSELRESFLQYFRNHGHTIVPSSSVIPTDDPTLLFTNAGMNQFKDVFLGSGKRPYVRAADTQKCIRVSGKHNDLEEVGRDTYHHTFFEMLGNWSFGDYYKKEAITWAWDLLTNVWGLEKKRLYATVFETDEEAEQLWKTVTDIDPSHVLRFGKKDNFWEMGETGPCGPCSEIHVDLTPDCSGGGLVNAGDPRVMEIWNLVFIQYNRDDAGTLTPLPAKHVDTGMGFERICAVLQGRKSNYDTDVFMPIIGRIAEISGMKYTGSLDAPTDIAMRVIADHARMLSFSIADGGIPSNEGRGYVMRRILRRAARFGRTLGFHKPFLYQVVRAVVDSMGRQFPELQHRMEHVERVIRGEEESFNQTLDRGLEIFDSVVSRLGQSKTFPGEDAFKLYDTYGFPLDLTEMMALERGLSVETSRFAELMDEQRERSRGAVHEVSTGGTGNMSVRSGVSRGKEVPTRFIGYNELQHEAVIEQLIDGSQVALDRTALYVESGGQVSDSGTLEGAGFVAEVRKSYKNGGQIIHELSVNVDNLPDVVGTRVRVRVDAGRRKNIERNHSATHLVHEALRSVLGTHLHQQGSLVAPDRLRFDFNHFEKIGPDHLKAIEQIVNEKIALDIPVHALNDPSDWLTIDEAKKRYPNVKMFFGDKYGDRVRIVEIDPSFSVELCGGTHVRNTREIGLFKIVSESAVASGVRRIEAVTGDGLRSYVGERIGMAGGIDARLEKLIVERETLERELGHTTDTNETRKPAREILTVPDEITAVSVGIVEAAIKEREHILEEVTGDIAILRKELSKSRVKDASANLDALVSGGVAVNDVTVVSSRVNAGSMDELKSIGDALRAKLTRGVGLLGADIDGKVALVCVVTDDLLKSSGLKAGTIVGNIAARVGGAGGGRPHMATAGGKDVAELDNALRAVPDVVRSLLS